METLILSQDQTKIAAEIIKNGGIVAMPTETVYGLAGNALDGSVVSKIFSAKGRPSDNPLIVHVSSCEEIYPLVREFPENAKILIKNFCPGPLTIVLPKSDLIPTEVSGGLDTVGIRMPSHKTAARLIKECGVPLAAPSANLSGSPSPTCAQHVKRDLFGKIDAIIDAGSCSVGLESTVVSLNDDKVRILRPGGITPEMIEAVLGKGSVIIDPAVINPLRDNEKAASPGMKYKHYSPKAKVIILKAESEAYYNFLNNNKDENIAALCFDEDIKHINIPCISLGKSDDANEQAKRLFDALRKTDDCGYKTVYTRCPSLDGMGLAVYNRLIRAAGFQILNFPDNGVIACAAIK